jgi:lactoylglutathione lyase
VERFIEGHMSKAGELLSAVADVAAGEEFERWTHDVERRDGYRRRGALRYLARVPLRAFPVIYAHDVERVAAFYVRLGFEAHVRMAAEDGSTGFVGLRREGAEMAVTTEASPRLLAGVEPGPGPRHEMFVYVEALDEAVSAVRELEATVLREPADMPWGERLAFVRDPEGNVVTLAAAVT